MNIETKTEEAIAGLILRAAPTAQPRTADDASQQTDFSGVEVKAATQGTTTHAAGNARPISELAVTVSIRSMIPGLDAPAVARLWATIATAILTPMPPVPPQTWAQAIPALADFQFFSVMGETTSERTNDDERRRHTRTFKILAG